MFAYLPANDILHAPVLHSNRQISPLVEATKGSVRWVAASRIGARLWRLGGPPCWATPMSLDGLPLAYP